MTDFKLFSTEITKAGSGSTYKITGSKGMSDYYRYYCQKHGHIDPAIFSKVYKLITDKIILHLLNYHRFQLPHGMGTIEVINYLLTSVYKDGKIKTNRPVNWGATLKLWHEDEECRKDKVLIRQDRLQMTKLIYVKNKARYKDRRCYRFEFTRRIKKQFNELNI